MRPVFADSFAMASMFRWQICLFMPREVRHLTARAKPAPEVGAKHFSRRLQTLSETKDQFRLNVELPICFDNQGKMEVDFLCAKRKLVIELDGAQHLNDIEAYRRDRRKDALLQRHGYFVLRFLAEDIARHLDQILDAILAGLVSRDTQA
jgi:very-short-patch-repair endonuclease